MGALPEDLRNEMLNAWSTSGFWKPSNPQCIDEVIERIVDEKLKEKLGSLGLRAFRTVSKEIAQSDIESFLSMLQSENVKSVSIFEISRRLSLPVDQVEEIMETLTKTRRIREENE